MPQRFRLSARFKSVVYAWQGLWFMIQTQHNAWVHLLASAAVVGTGWYCGVSASDWRWLVASIAAVWAAEAVNTAIEYACDAVSPCYSEAVKHAKDIAAGSVLIAAITAALIGALTFWPYISP